MTVTERFTTADVLDIHESVYSKDILTIPEEDVIFKSTVLEITYNIILEL